MTILNKMKKFQWLVWAMSISIEEIKAAFSPAREILDPSKFVGRREQIKDAMVSLTNEGSFMAIYGLRGVGKSSIASQIKLIAEGKTELPNILNLTQYIPSKGFDFITIYTKVDHFMDNVSDLIKRIMFGDDSNPSLFSFSKDGERMLESFKRTIQVDGSVGVFSTKASTSGKEESSYKTIRTDDLIQNFKALLRTIEDNNRNKSGLLILIDEFDVLKNKDGFASLVKTCSSDFVRFGVIGIANTITELVVDHASVGRQIESIEVTLMPKIELMSILDKAEERVGNKIRFDQHSKELIVKQAEGFPYFVHLLGREAMLVAFDLGKKIIDKSIMDDLNTKIKAGRLSTIYEGIYHDAVKNSPQRELLLKAFAERPEDEIYTEDVYGLVKAMGVTNPSALMKELTAPEDKRPVLVKVRDRYFRFLDPVFKVYAKIRNWKFD
ncbi:hypothetical protein [Brevibacillus sp. H7]|uniref:hypothetical protein n=1 Tax=Brevibacillus sp. H7 TaxID=3349138 RepID=UPI00382AE31D